MFFFIFFLSKERRLLCGAAHETSDTQTPSDFREVQVPNDRDVERVLFGNDAQA